MALKKPFFFSVLSKEIFLSYLYQRFPRILYVAKCALLNLKVKDLPKKKKTHLKLKSICKSEGRGLKYESSHPTLAEWKDRAREGKGPPNFRKMPYIVCKFYFFIHLAPSNFFIFSYWDLFKSYFF